PRRDAAAGAALIRHVLPPIRTFTVGTGIPPVQPADGFGRVADCHRRFGLSPTPEHAFVLSPTSVPRGGIPPPDRGPVTGAGPYGRSRPARTGRLGGGKAGRRRAAEGG